MTSSIQFDMSPGYLQLPELFVRNESKNTITFNSGLFSWELGAIDTPNNHGPLPWQVASAPGFQRLWNAGAVTVARDEAFQNIITDLPDTGTGGGQAAVVFRQETPQTVTVIPHNFNRIGPVNIAICSLDQQTEYFGFLTDYPDPNTCRVTFDDPTAFIATVS